MKEYYGEFNNNGYEIWLNGENGDAVYRAGNCKFDSAQWLPPNAPGTIDIATIEEFCESTGKEIAKENGGAWMGAKKVDDYDSPL